MIQNLRKLVPVEEFDYQTLLEALKEYAKPRAKITALLRKGEIIRVKKGLYIFGDDFRKKPIFKEVLANLIYGPSYVSLEYALHYYGLIPEAVTTITSVTIGRSRKFRTPVGVFSYQKIPISAYSLGFNKIEMSEGISFLMAEPEKALADKIKNDWGTSLRSQKDMEYYLLKDLRIDESTLFKLDPRKVEEFSKVYKSRKLDYLAKWLRKCIQR